MLLYYDSFILPFPGYSGVNFTLVLESILKLKPVIDPLLSHLHLTW